MEDPLDSNHWLWEIRDEIALCVPAVCRSRMTPHLQTLFRKVRELEEMASCWEAAAESLPDDVIQDIIGSVKAR